MLQSWGHACVCVRTLIEQSTAVLCTRPSLLRLVTSDGVGNGAPPSRQPAPRSLIRCLSGHAPCHAETCLTNHHCICFTLLIIAVCYSASGMVWYGLNDTLQQASNAKPSHPMACNPLTLAQACQQRHMFGTLIKSKWHMHTEPVGRRTRSASKPFAVLTVGGIMSAARVTRMQREMSRNSRLCLTRGESRKARMPSALMREQPASTSTCRARAHSAIQDTHASGATLVRAQTYP